jgi:tetratricopeptide (TPR) repeat protein
MSSPAAPNPALAMQMAVKQNAQELNAYLKDLQSWSGSVKQKDEALKAGSLVLTKAAAAPPPIRGANAAAKAQPVLLPSSASADEARFAESKAAGNAAFAAGRFEESLPHYSQCMLLNPRDAIIPSNRSQALLKLQRWHEAEVDASTALSIDPAQVKALFRRAQARRQLRKYAGAMEDCQALEKLDPSNKAAKALGVEVASLLQKQQEAKAKAAQPIVSAVAAKPAPAATSIAAGTTATAPAGARRMIIQEEESDEEEAVPIRKSAVPSVPPAAAVSTVKPTTAAPAPQSATAAAVRPAAPATLPSGAAPSAASPSVSAAAPSVAASSSTAASPASPSSATVHAAASSASLRVPSTAYEFDQAFRSCSGDLGQLAKLLQLIPLQQYSQLMKTSLDSQMLKTTVQAVAAHLSNSDTSSAVRVLEGLSTVPRFNVARLMLAAPEKQAIAAVLRNAAAAPDASTKEHVIAVAALYAVTL